jgi:FeS assembly SUF system protein
VYAENGMSEDVQIKPEVPAEAVQGAVPGSGAGPAMTPEELEAFGNVLIAALKTVYDPEIPVDIYELGLIYKVDVADNKDVTIDMTLTSPGCPVAGEMPNMVTEALKTVKGVGEVKVNMTFDPPWTPQRMSEEAKLELNMF